MPRYTTQADACSIMTNDVTPRERETSAERDLIRHRQPSLIYRFSTLGCAWIGAGSEWIGRGGGRRVSDGCSRAASASSGRAVTSASASERPDRDRDRGQAREMRWANGRAERGAWLMSGAMQTRRPAARHLNKYSAAPLKAYHYSNAIQNYVWKRKSALKKIQTLTK